VLGGQELIIILRADVGAYQIIYVAIIGTVMIAALLEWFLWLAAFLYCLWKVFRKANTWTIKFMAVVNAIVFVCLR
jgi:chitin synthase